MRLFKHSRSARLCARGFILFLLIINLSGCWDIVPIEDRALVMVIGVDQVENRIRLSAQVPTIKNLIQTTSNFTDRQKPMVKPFVVESVSMLDAIQQLEDRIYKSMIIGSVKMIIVSPQAPQKDLVNILTVFLRQPMVSFQTLVLSSEEKPEEIIGFEAPFDIQPGIIIGKQQRSALKLAHSFPIELWDFIARIDNRTSDPFLPVIKLDQENKSYLLQGIKVFNKDKIVGTLSPDESYLFGILTNKVEEGYQEITVKNQEIGFSKVQYKSKIRIVSRQNQGRIPPDAARPDATNTSAIRVEVKASGTLLQIPKGFPNQVESYKLFKKEMEKQLRRQVLSFIKKLQFLNTDPVGFRKQLEVAGIKNWSEVYPRIPVEVNVHFDYRNLSPAF